MSKLHSRENTTLKMRGAGDGLKNGTKTPCKPIERVPVRSARKFTASLGPQDPSIEKKLKKALDELEASPLKLKKAKSVAEITPTKSKLKEKKAKPGGNDDDSTIMLHATPRPHMAAVVMSPSRRLCYCYDDEQRRMGGLIYQRLIVFAWRRSKDRVAMLSESLRRRQEQICKLEQQVTCLKDLNQSECDKRNAAIGERQKIEMILELVKQEKQELVQEKAVIDGEREKLALKCQHLDDALNKTLNEYDGQCLQIKQLENALAVESSKVKQMQEVQMVAVGQLQKLENEILLKDETISKLQESFRNTENELVDLKLLHKTQASDFADLLIKHTKVLDENDKKKIELENLNRMRIKMKQRIDNMENELMDLTRDYEKVLRENKSLSESMNQYEQDRKCLWNNAKEILTVSWTVLQNAAYIMLPAAR